MAALTITPADVSVVEWGDKHTGYATEAIDRGELVRFVPASGKVELANSAAAGNLGARNWLAVGEAPAAGNILTIAGEGSLISLGAALDGLNFDAAVYANDTDGVLGDAAGTSSRVVGRVEPLYGYGDAIKKGLRIV